MNENGTVVQYGAERGGLPHRRADRKVVDFIDRAEANDAQPFFLHFTPTAPHGGHGPERPADPGPAARRDVRRGAGPADAVVQRGGRQRQAAAVRNLPLLTAAQIAAIDREYQTRLESLQALDEGIGRIIDTLAARGELDNTYIVFTSDNGYHLGQHRFFDGKFQVYEEDIRVPLIIRGPGVQAGRHARPDGGQHRLRPDHRRAGGRDRRTA